MKKRHLLAGTALSLLLLGFGAYSTYWLHLAGKLRQGVLDEAARRRAQGYDSAWEGFQVEGYPAALRLVLIRPSLTHEAAAGKWTVRAEQLVAEARPWTPGEWRADARGIVFEDGPQNRTGETRIDGAMANIAFPPAPPANHQQTAFAADGVLSRLTLSGPVPGLGAAIETISLSFTVKGAVDREPSAWRDDGGTVELQRSEIAWGPLSATATGTLALDDRMQPMGALTARIQGYGAAIDALVAGKAIQPADATLAKFALGTLSKTGADGKPRIEAPVTLQNGFLYLGAAKLARLPEIAWK